MITQLELTCHTDDTSLIQERQTAIKRLLSLKLSPLPVAPAQDANQYPARDKQNNLIINPDGSIKPLFNGKNPSYLGSDGVPRVIPHSDYQHRQPTDDELDRWFENPLNGLGYLHTSLAPNLRTLDIDSKDFESKADCSRSLDQLLALPEFEGADVQGTRNGGYHILIECEADFTNFKFKDFESVDKKHGELLGVGRFVVCAPSTGYQVLSAGSPAIVKSLERLGIQPSRVESKPVAINPVITLPGEPISFEAAKVAPVKVDQPIPLYRLLSNATKSYINGENGKKGDRSKILTRVRNECAGWVNWCERNNVPIRDESDDLIALAAKNLGIDEERKSRILNKLRPLSDCNPPIFSYQGDDGCWNVIRRLLGLKTDYKTLAIGIHHNKRAKRRTFKADSQINQEFLDPGILTSALEQFDIVALKSPMGSGKTEVLKPVRSAYSDVGGILIGSRNSLLIQTVERLSVEKPIYHLQTDDAKLFTLDSKSWLALCVDSLHHFSDPSQFDDRVVILDEVVSSMCHALLSPTVASQKGGRPLHLNLFEESIKRASKVILLDGNLDDQACEWVRSIRAKGERGAAILKIENTFKPARKAVTIVTTIEGESEKYHDSSPLLRHVKDVLNSHRDVESGAKAIGFIADSQSRLESLDRWLTRLGYKVLRIDSQTIEDKEIREILRNPNEAIEREQYDAVLLSPTVEMGLDISIKNYFVAVFADFGGLLSTNSQTQFLNRFRDCDRWFIHCVKFTNLQQYKSLDDIMSVVEMGVRKSWDGENQTAILNHALNELKIAKESIHYSFTEGILADLIHERRNSYFCLNEELRKSHDVSEIKVETCDWERGENKNIREEIRDEKSQGILRSEIISIEEARELSKKLGKSEAERAEIDKAFILDRLPGLDQSPLWNVDLIRHLKFEDRFKNVKQLERYWLVNNLIDAKLINQRSLAVSMSEEGKDIRKLKSFCPWDIRSEFAVCSALAELGLMNLLDGRAYRADSPEIVAISTAIRESADYQKALNVKPTEAPIKMIGVIFGLIGVKSERSQPRDASTGKQVSEYTYTTLTDEDVFSERNAAILECIDQRMIERLSDREGKRYEAPSDKDFDTDDLIISELPSYREWMSKSEASNVEMLWKAALDSDREFGCEDAQKEVVRVVISLWQIQQGNDEKLSKGV